MLARIFTVQRDETLLDDWLRRERARRGTRYSRREETNARAPRGTARRRYHASLVGWRNVHVLDHGHRAARRRGRARAARVVPFAGAFRDKAQALSAEMRARGGDALPIPLDADEFLAVETTRAAERLDAARRAPPGGAAAAASRAACASAARGAPRARAAADAVRDARDKSSLRCARRRARAAARAAPAPAPA